MQTRNLGIVMDQGADFSLVIGIFGDDGAIDITGYQFLSQMRADTSDDPEDPIAEFSFEILDQVANKGQVRWYMAKADIESIAASTSSAMYKSRLTTPFVFDVKMKDLSGAVSRIIQGIAFISPQATEESFS